MSWPVAGNLAVLLALLAGPIGLAAAEKDARTGFIPLFDGKTLRKWSEITSRFAAKPGR